MQTAVIKGIGIHTILMLLTYYSNISIVQHVVLPFYHYVDICALPLTCLICLDTLDSS